MRALAVTALSWVLGGVAISAATFEELAQQAAAARRANQIEQALALYRQALEANAAWPEGWWFLGTLSYSAYRYSDCEEAFDQFVRLDAKRGLAWALAGLCEFETGKYDRSFEHLQRGLAPGSQLPPEIDAGVRFHYALLLTRAGRFDQARRELEPFAQGCDKEPVLLAGIGLNALHDPRVPKDVSPDRQDLVTKAGTATCAWMVRSADKADTGFRALLDAYPNVPGVHYLYGSFLVALQPEQAHREFTRELALNPGNADAHAMLSLMSFNTGDTMSAMAEAKKAVATSAPDALCDYAYGEALIRVGDVQTATGRLEDAERLDPEALEYHTALAGAYARSGRNQDARRERQQALDMATGQAGGD